MPKQSSTHSLLLHPFPRCDIRLCLFVLVRCSVAPALLSNSSAAATRSCSCESKMQGTNAHRDECEKQSITECTLLLNASVQHSDVCVKVSPITQPARFSHLLCVHPAGTFAPCELIAVACVSAEGVRVVGSGACVMVVVRVLWLLLRMHCRGCVSAFSTSIQRTAGCVL